MESALDRDTAIYLLDHDGGPADAADFFGEFLNLDGDEAPETPIDTGRNGNPDAFFTNPAAMLTTSSVVSSADERDYFATSSRLGNASSAASHGNENRNNTAELAFGDASDPARGGTAHALGYLGRRSMSDNDLHRLEDISLRSPQNNVSSVPPTSSSTPPNTTGRSKQFVAALSSGFRKATNTLGRRNRKEQQQQQERQQLSLQRPASPTLEHPPMAIHPRPQRMHSITHTSTGSVSHESPSPLAYNPSPSAFATSFPDHPFAEQPRAYPSYPSPNIQYFNDGGMGPTAVHGSTRRIKSEQQLYQGSPSMISSTATVDAASQMPQQQQQQQHQQGGWQHPLTTPTAPEPWGGSEYVTSQDPRWWDFSMNASVNQAMHSQHGELPYEYGPLPDTSATGLMIHMPQLHPSQQGAVNDIALTAQTYIPPPPPIPATERNNRPPRAPSSGTRHRNVSSSPMRRTRRPSASASPTQVHSQMRNQSRHSSTGSISSVRSASGRAPGSAPNTPGGVRKRRSRDVLGGNIGGGINLGGGGGDELGFVNFTPNDGNVLMTGVAPSGSSKTKARREKEAQDKRRKLSEAAMKAVAAAGGDVDKLLGEGFEF
ncbi:hypothetical protein TGAM01_v208618 [Trichoderma gamsii]|uniref:Developmental regulatory protein wetA n=1 Tax=Trichoderma gamsii TaxID=398673 RepID=A0A0W7VM11_9HYPO|nr:hypothetical protein TGAM01_v208618 [Trichoderma gamsii]PNP43839.1 hypothetical protein TGAMA5MH_04121 [Trichoderma gamsii]PON22534.1 hypothetical protein TGAM01_v208618 [Trichoderma gamsii]